MASVDDRTMNDVEGETEAAAAAIPIANPRAAALDTAILMHDTQNHDASAKEAGSNDRTTNNVEEETKAVVNSMIDQIEAAAAVDTTNGKDEKDSTDTEKDNYKASSDDDFLTTLLLVALAAYAMILFKVLSTRGNTGIKIPVFRSKKKERKIIHGRAFYFNKKSQNNVQYASKEEIPGLEPVDDSSNSSSSSSANSSNNGNDGKNFRNSRRNGGVPLVIQTGRQSLTPTINKRKRANSVSEYSDSNSMAQNGKRTRTGYVSNALFAKMGHTFNAINALRNSDKNKVRGTSSARSPTATDSVSVSSDDSTTDEERPKGAPSVHPKTLKTIKRCLKKSSWIWNYELDDDDMMENLEMVQHSIKKSQGASNIKTLSDKLYNQLYEEEEFLQIAHEFTQAIAQQAQCTGKSSAHKRVTMKWLRNASGMVRESKIHKLALEELNDRILHANDDDDDGEDGEGERGRRSSRVRSRHSKKKVEEKELKNFQILSAAVKKYEKDFISRPTRRQQARATKSKRDIASSTSLSRTSSRTTKAAKASKKLDRKPFVCNIDDSAFPVKLFSMIDLATLENPDVCSWSRDGRSFIIDSKSDELPSILRRHFNHSRWLSFSRQLNNYGFTLVANEGQKTYYHPKFHRDIHDPDTLAKLLPYLPGKASRQANPQPKPQPKQVRRRSLSVTKSTSPSTKSSSSSSSEDEPVATSRRGSTRRTKNSSNLHSSPVITATSDPGYSFEVHQVLDETKPYWAIQVTLTVPLTTLGVELNPPPYASRGADVINVRNPNLVGWIQQGNVLVAVDNIPLGVITTKEEFRANVSSKLRTQEPTILMFRSPTKPPRFRRKASPRSERNMEILI